MICQRWLVSGVVQGVGYRAWMRDKAVALHVEGWVRNRHDGTVEALVQGERHALQSLYQECLRGPPAACVDGIAVSDAQSEPSVGGFEQRASL